ncbi:MAG: S1C family serine protease [Acidimicrobiales bacterium]
MPLEDEPEEAPGFGPPLPQDDRLWRHPSELGSGTPITVVASAPNRRRTIGIGVASGLVGAAAMLVAVFAVGGFQAKRTVRPVETIQLSAPKDPAPTELAIADGVFPAVARLDATRATGTVSSTAVVFRDDGHLLTTADAVEAADTLTVQLYDGTVLPAVVVGVDRATDVAVVKVEREQLKTAVLGMDTALQLGEPTIAIECTPGKAGSPDVSVGLISALDRRVDDDNGMSMHGMIQTNVRVSSAGSGAVLVDSTGAVIGLVTRRGLGGADGDPGATETTNPVNTKAAVLVPRYATPIGFAKSEADELITLGHVVHSWLGVESRDLSDSETDKLGRTGARVDSVTPGSPAANAGLQAGDIVLGIDNHPIGSSSDLVVALREYKPNQSVGITYERDGGDQVAIAILAEKLSVP